MAIFAMGQQEIQLHWLAWVVVALAISNGTWMTFDGTRALATGQYVTPTSGDYKGQLWPWAQLLSKVRIEPLWPAVRFLIALFGIALVSAAVAYSQGQVWAWTALVILSAVGLFYFPFGTAIHSILLIILWITPFDIPMQNEAPHLAGGFIRLAAAFLFLISRVQADTLERFERRLRDYISWITSRERWKDWTSEFLSAAGFVIRRSFLVVLALATLIFVASANVIFIGAILTTFILPLTLIPEQFLEDVIAFIQDSPGLLFRLWILGIVVLVIDYRIIGFLDSRAQAGSSSDEEGDSKPMERFWVVLFLAAAVPCFLLSIAPGLSAIVFIVVLLPFAGLATSAIAALLFVVTVVFALIIAIIALLAALLGPSLTYATLLITYYPYGRFDWLVASLKEYRTIPFLAGLLLIFSLILDLYILP